jgi:hypothetical protein
MAGSLNRNEYGEEKPLGVAIFFMALLVGLCLTVFAIIDAVRYTKVHKPSPTCIEAAK